MDEMLRLAGRAARRALGEGATVCEIERWGGGAHNDGFKLRLADGRLLFLKVEKPTIRTRTRRGQVQREVRGLALARQAGVDCAVVLDYAADGADGAGRRYLLEEFIAGDLLGEVLPTLPAEEQAALYAEFRERTDPLTRLHSDRFGEIYPGGALGQSDSWRDWLASLARILREDAAELGAYSPAEMDIITRAHEAALGRISYQGPATFVHLDLHEFNAFAAREDGRVRVGKLFDFGFCLYLAPYAAHYGPQAFGGEEEALAARYGAAADELRAFALLFGMEIVVFFNEIRFAPDQPYGYLAQTRAYLERCAAYLA